MKIRRARLSDASYIYRALNHTPELRDYDGDDEEYPKYWVNGAINDKKGNLVLVAEEDKKFMGFTIVHLLRGVLDALRHSLYVFPSYRNKGIASALSKASESYLREHGYKWSVGFVNTSNKKMQKFMAKNDYNSGNKFYVYWKVLQ